VGDRGRAGTVGARRRHRVRERQGEARGAAARDEAGACVG
jgi:hypothetical protein